MSQKSSNKALLVLVGLLAILLLISLYFGYGYQQEVKKNKAAFETEISMKVADLKALQQQYDNLLVENAANKEEVEAVKQRLSKFLDSIQKLPATVEVVTKVAKSKNFFAKELEMLKAENRMLKQQNFVLVKENKTLSGEVSTLQTEMRKVGDSLEQSAKKLDEVMFKAQRLKINDATAKAVRIKKSNRVVETQRARKVTGIEACFDVQENDLTPGGFKEFFIQLLAPNGEVIGGKYTIKEENVEVKFSKIAKFRYENKSVSVCDFIKPLSTQSFEAGKYIINIYDGIKMIGTSSVVLK